MRQIKRADCILEASQHSAHLTPTPAFLNQRDPANFNADSNALGSDPSCSGDKPINRGRGAKIAGEKVCGGSDGWNPEANDQAWRWIRAEVGSFGDSHRNNE
jgi:hypothetical protein